MIKQITEKSIGKKIHNHLFYTTNMFLFFEVTNMDKKINSLFDYLTEKQNTPLPKGIYSLDTVEENKIFQIGYNCNEITEENVINFAKSLDL